MTDKPKVRQAIILLTVHEDPSTEDGEPSNSLCTGSQLGKYGISLCKLNIWPTPRTRLIETTAHELGHVLSQLFETEAHKADPRHDATPRQRALRMGLVPPEPAKRIYDAEAEAWDFAVKMVADLAPEAREVALNSYQKGIDMWKRDATIKEGSSGPSDVPDRYRRRRPR